MDVVALAQLGLRQRRRDARHRLHRRARAEAASASPTRSSSASTATPPAAAPPAARSRPACRTPATRAASASCSCRPSTTPTPTCASTARAAFERCVAEAVPLSRQLVAVAADGCDLDTAEGRARLVAQARPLLAQLPDGVLRGQIGDELAAAARISPAELRDAGRARRRARAPARPRARPCPACRAQRCDVRTCAGRWRRWPARWTARSGC